MKTPMQELIQYMWDNDMDLLLTTPFKQKIDELTKKEKQMVIDAYERGFGMGEIPLPDDKSMEVQAEQYYNDKFKP